MQCRDETKHSPKTKVQGGIGKGRGPSMLQTQPGRKEPTKMRKKVEACPILQNDSKKPKTRTLRRKATEENLVHYPSDRLLIMTQTKEPPIRRLLIQKTGGGQRAELKVPRPGNRGETGGKQGARQNTCPRLLVFPQKSENISTLPYMKTFKKPLKAKLNRAVNRGSKAGIPRVMVTECRRSKMTAMSTTSI